MTAVIPLGNFERVPLRDAWPTEDGNFTPWLAQQHAIGLLGEALGLNLEVEATEHWVGPFRADILARVPDDVAESEHRVVIENQFGRTNHGHLGQILTYLAGIEHAKTVVWVAETIQPDHRAAIDWLNANTAEDFSFFALEIELWRIGNSMPAPRFNIIASPNDWTKTARRASTQVEARAGERQSLLLSYWDSFNEYLHRRASNNFLPRRAPTGNVMWFPVGRSGTVIAAIVTTEKRQIGVALYTDKSTFLALKAQRLAIDTQIGEPIDWQELPGQKRSRINLYKQGEDPAEESKREQQYAWLFAKLELFWAAFTNRLRALPPRSAAEENDSEQPTESE